MASFLSGSLAATINAAFTNVFLPATLTRGATVYSCKAIFENQDQFLIGLTTSYSYKVLILANSLAVAPLIGDIINLQGITLTIISDSESKPAIAVDPARAVWTVRSRPLSGTSGGGVDPSIGELYQLYRPTAPFTNPIVAGNQLPDIMVLFTVAKTSFSLKRAASESEFFWYASLDRTLVQTGDFLVGNGYTYYIAGIDHLLPVNVVRCNAIITGLSPKAQAVASGLSVATLKPYTGTTANTSVLTGDDIIFQGMPGLIKFVSPLSRGAGSTLPSDTHAPGAYDIYLPPVSVARGVLANRDVLQDDLGNRFQIEDAYWSNIGYRPRARLLEV